MTRLAAADAFRRSLDNPSARMRGQTAGRSGEVWPQLRPSFRFDRTTRIFAIGSCFASNIVADLTDRGYDMRSAPQRLGIDLPIQSLNKYTPATIRQAVEWARRIYDRDDRMTPEDARPLMVQRDDGLVMDCQLHGIGFEDEAAAIERRGQVYRIYRELFDCEVVILTLGLVEAWWDDRLGLYHQSAPSREMMRDEGRYFFERLDYPRCLDEMHRTIALIRDGRPGPKILITTSPVVLGRTFTADDIHTANTYSKSVLRAVSGRLAEEVPALDYFPSFESVVLSPHETTYEDDQVHVRPAFVAQIMARVRGAYAESEDDEAKALDAASKFLKAVEDGGPDDLAALAGMIDTARFKVSLDAAFAAAFVRLLDGDLDAARREIPAELQLSSFRRQGYAMAVAALLDLHGAGAEAEDLRTALGPLAREATTIRKAAELVLRYQRRDVLARLVEAWDTSGLWQAGPAGRIVALCREAGDAVSERRVLAALAATVPETPPTLLVRLGELQLDAGETALAVATLNRAAESAGHARGLTQRAVAMLRKAGHESEAAALAGRISLRPGSGPGRPTEDTRP